MDSDQVPMGSPDETATPGSERTGRLSTARRPPAGRGGDLRDQVFPRPSSRLWTQASSQLISTTE